MNRENEDNMRGCKVTVSPQDPLHIGGSRGAGDIVYLRVGNFHTPHCHCDECNRNLVALAIEHMLKQLQ